MNELDKRIKEALQGEDAEWMSQLEQEPSTFEMVLEIYRGKHLWFNVLTTVMMIAFFGLAIFSAVRFFNATETRDLIMWASAMLFFMSGTWMMKVWCWMEMNKNSVTREIKRLELQVARLANRIKG
jgi:Family of unknown function (DUF6768)